MKHKVERFYRALNWVKQNTIKGQGIAVTSKQRKIYPEVTGYYIPTLLRWGEHELAASFAKYLISTQKDDGSWYDSDDKDPYVFDSAQILKGLLAIRDILPEVDNHIIKGCDWILSNMKEDGRLTTPNKDAWGNDDSICSELIHIYCLTPIRDAGIFFDKQEYLSAVEKILEFYKVNYRDKIEKFSLLSHFYAYVLEGLFDLGEVNLCRKAMTNIEKYQDSKGGLRGLNDVSWVCSTGQFQIALVWYKLGELEKGNRLFNYMLSRQNKSGGWNGSYPTNFMINKIYKGRKKAFYFPNEEISWAVKYFLDALAYKEQLEFEKQASSFIDKIDDNDGRYILIRKFVKSKENGKTLKICDVGAGKGRYLKNLVRECPDNEYYATDISVKVMSDIKEAKEKKVGSMTQLPYEDDYFDIAYACEAFEHAINISAAFNEMYRIVKPNGYVIIIDKPIEKLGQLELDEWEQWIDDKDIMEFARARGGIVEIEKAVPYEDKDDGLFRAWIITKK